MRANQAMYSIAMMCRLLEVSTSGYYTWRRRKTSQRARADAALLGRIREIHVASCRTYGAPRIHAELAAEGTLVGRKRVARLMRGANLAGVSRRKGPRTTQRREGDRPAPDLVDRKFSAETPDRLWVAEHNSGLPEDKRIEFRVGINLGDVVIDGDDIHGDGVNIAARRSSPRRSRR